MLRFEDLSPAEKRVVIAQDVIKQIRLKNITPVRGLTLAYIEGNYSDYNYNKNGCRACAVGSLFVAQMLKEQHDNVNDVLSEYSRNENITAVTIRSQIIRKYFSSIQERLIESAFEVHSYLREGQDGYNEPVSHNLMDAAVEFGEQYEDATDRLVAIMENIIENKGCFVPVKAACTC
jgi:hypothetical protein